MCILFPLSFLPCLSDFHPRRHHCTLVRVTGDLCIAQPNGQCQSSSALACQSGLTLLFILSCFPPGFQDLSLFWFLFYSIGHSIIPHPSWFFLLPSIFREWCVLGLSPGASFSQSAPTSWIIGPSFMPLYADHYQIYISASGLSVRDLTGCFIYSSLSP